MANKLRGEIELVDGETTYILHLGINAIAEVEELLDKGIAEIIGSLDPMSVRFGTLRAILWGALRKHHPNLTLLDVGDLIERVGASLIGPKVGDAIAAAFPDPEVSGENPPQTKQGGTGTAS